MLLDIHLEWCDDKGERLEKIAKIGKPFNISLVPVLMLPKHEVFKNGVYRRDYFYNKDIMEFLKKIPKDYPYISFGQQGFAHYCPDCYKTEIKTKDEKERKFRVRKFRRDPWHENKCLYIFKESAEESIERQLNFMRKGKNIIEDTLYVSPLIYVTPNHQYDNNTKIAAEEMNYNYFATKGIINILPYSEKGLKVLPERKLGQDGEIFYTHYDKIKDNLDEYLEIIKSSTSLSGIYFQEKPTTQTKLNDKLITASKWARDKGLG